MDYIKFGSGKKNFVILPGLSVHSILRYAREIQAAYQCFCDEYTVYVFDREENLSPGYTVQDMARDTAAAMARLQIESADVFGASQGGMIALYLAIDHPALVHKMILGSTLAEPNATFEQIVEKWIDCARRKDAAGLVTGFVDAVYSPQTLAVHREALIASELEITDAEFERFLILAQACRGYNCTRRLTAVQCPTLVIGSAGDRVTTADGARQLAQALNCTFWLYGEEYGHGVYDEAPDYKKRCLDFLHS